MKKDYEKYLNELFSVSLSEEQAYDKLSYLKEGKISKDNIVEAYSKHQLGTLFRRYNPTGFGNEYEAWIALKQTKSSSAINSIFNNR